MEPDDEVDIEGEFELKAGDLLGSFCDINELPSKSVDLQPEFSEHPWMLEQGWSLDHCADEKSKAVIKEMLLEEQSYIDGPKPSTEPESPTKTNAGLMIPGCTTELKNMNSKTTSTRGKHWDEEEKAIFFKGLELHGRKWSKIAELIPTRTAEQVKHFGQHYYKMKNKPAKKKPKPATTTSPIATVPGLSLKNISLKNVIPTHAPTLEAMLKTVTTAQPTVNILARVPVMNKTSGGGAPLIATSTVTKPNVIAPTHTIPQSGMMQSSTVPSNGGVKKKSESPRRPPAKKQVKRSRSCENPVNKSDVSEEIVRIVKSETHSEDEDVLIDVDSDREEYTQRRRLISALHLNGTMDSSSAPAPPLSPFKPHFPASAIPTSPGKTSGGSGGSGLEITALGLMGDSVLIKEEPGFPLSPLPNIPEMDQKLDPSTIPSSDDSGFLPSSLGNSDFSPNEFLDNDMGAMSAEAKVELLTPVTTGSICRSSSSPDLHYLIGGPLSMRPESTLAASGYTASMTASTSGGNSGFDYMTKPRCNSEVGYARYTASEGAGGGNEEERSWRGGYDYDNAEASSGESETEEHPNEYGVVTSDGEVVYLPNPIQERILASEEILDEEKTIHSEFFDGRRGLKNEERYLKIRNYILDSWEKQKPIYLNKTSVRPGLKNCGDVNCIGRIHSYLEQIGAINFGCAEVQYKKKGVRGGLGSVKTNKDRTPKEVLDTLAAARSECMRPRKRKVRELFTMGHWSDQEIGGRTIEHKSDGEEVEEERRPPRIRPKALRGRHSKTQGAAAYDPFKLVPCQAFTPANPAPFSVVVESAVLVVMDAHAHLSRTEVIGLLGGRYLREQGRLHITRAEPCHSLSTGMQCEMDPVSQMQASEKILSKEATVVGWYHSHPTFDPNPSVRDIQTQEDFQSWFAEGGNPFVGMIISPYNRMALSLLSQTKCLVITKDHEHVSPNSHNHSSLGLGLPHEFEYRVSDALWKRSKVARKVTKLIQRYANYTNRVELLHHFKSINNITCLQKLMQSIDQYPAPESCDLHELQTEITAQVTSLFALSDQAHNHTG